MARNEERRRALTDAGLTVLSREGARGLTHRAVDREAGVPTGTTSNYFRTRDALIGALVTRIGERLAPTEDDIAARAGQVPDARLFAAYMRDIVRRLTDDRDVTIALFELRLEATRRPAVAELLDAWRQSGFEGDVAFNEAAGFVGGARDRPRGLHGAADRLGGMAVALHSAGRSAAVTRSHDGKTGGFRSDGG